MLHLPAFERLSEVIGITVFNEEIDALGGELALAGFQQGEDRIAAFDGVRFFDQGEEAALKADRNVRGDFREIPHVGDDFALSRVKFGGIDAREFGEIVAHGGSDETFGGVQLIRIADAFNHGLEHGREILFAVLFFDGGQ